MFNDVAMLRNFDAYDRDFYRDDGKLDENSDLFKSAISRYLSHTNENIFFNMVLPKPQVTDKGFGFSSFSFVYYTKNLYDAWKKRMESISVFIPANWISRVQEGKEVTIKKGPKGLRVVGFFEKAPSLEKAAVKFLERELEEDAIRGKEYLKQREGCVAVKHFSGLYGQWKEYYVFKGKLSLNDVAAKGIKVYTDRHEFSTNGKPICPAYVNPTEILVRDEGTELERTLVECSGGNEWAD